MHLKLVRPSTEAEKTTRTTVVTEEVTPAIVKSWKIPPFQRALKVSAKVVEIAYEIAKDDGVIPGVITLGVLGSDRYIIDGQHRREAFLLSECLVGYVDIRVAYYKDLSDMADEFDKLNSSIVRMRPDDRLRALESRVPALLKLREACEFVGYNQIRRGENSPLLSMGTTLRCWDMSSKEVPISGGGQAAGGVVEVAKRFEEKDVPAIADFLNAAYDAWGTDREYHRLWGNLNITMCMWLYRRIVLSKYSAKSVQIPLALFKKCLMALSASDQYVEWLRGRNANESSRGPGYKRVKDVFARRIVEETGTKPVFPMPSWATR